MAGRVVLDRVELSAGLDPSGKASPRKARRRGLRRTTSALATTILGAAIAASTVSAQQFLPSASARRGGSAATASESTPRRLGLLASPGRPGGQRPIPIFGMAATRGARYLLRNGLDYLSYQEYERALKYFREAETRQKELNDAERLSLKQGIERAQRGLREAVGSESPYALSKRSRRAGGFAPAKPDTLIAAAAPRTRTAPVGARTPAREGDDQGQPIRLAGAEEVAATPRRGVTAVAAAAAEPGQVPGRPPPERRFPVNPPRSLRSPSFRKLRTCPSCPTGRRDRSAARPCRHPNLRRRLPTLAPPMGCSPSRPSCTSR